MAWIVDENADQSVEKMICSLANVCDGAFSQDNKGFSAFDSEFGKKLAWIATKGYPWTEKQANVAIKLCFKYHKQLGGTAIKSWLSNPIFTREPGLTRQPNKPQRLLVSQDQNAFFRFSYDPDVVMAVKSIHGVHNQKKYWASWDAKDKVWSVPVNSSSIKQIMSVASKLNFEVEERFQIYIDKLRERFSADDMLLAFNNTNVSVSQDETHLIITDAAILEEFKRELCAA